MQVSTLQIRIICSVIMFMVEITHAEPLDANQSVPLEEYYFSAARTGDIVLLEEFIRAGIPVDHATTKGYTPLILAAYNGHLETVEWLIEQGANPCTQDNKGNTALMGAIFKGEFLIAKRLIQTNCKPDQKNHAGQTPLMFASLFAQQGLIKALKDRGADANLQDAMGNTATSLYNDAKSVY